MGRQKWQGGPFRLAPDCKSLTKKYKLYLPTSTLSSKRFCDQIWHAYIKLSSCFKTLYFNTRFSTRYEIAKAENVRINQVSAFCTAQEMSYTRLYISKASISPADFFTLSYWDYDNCVRYFNFIFSSSGELLWAFVFLLDRVFFLTKYMLLKSKHNKL